MRRRCLKRQTGQALALGISLLLIASLMLLAVFGIGRVADNKIRLVNAADAAAYSAALTQARAYNMQAYINTAQIGHQIAMAHLVTFASWTGFAQTEGRQAMRGNPPGYVIGMMFGPEHGSAYMQSAQSAGSIPGANNELYSAFRRHSETVHSVLHNASQSVQKTLDQARRNTVQQILQANYPDDRVVQTNMTAARFKSESADADALFNQIVKLGSPQKQISWSLKARSPKTPDVFFSPKGSYRDLFEKAAAMYSFLGPRNHTQKNPWVVDPRCPMLRHELRRRGTTSLAEDGSWQSMDTQSYHALRSNKWIGCYHREYPMGWAWVPGKSGTVTQDIQYTENPPENFSKQNFWRWVQSATDWGLSLKGQNPLANSYAISSQTRWNGGGLVPFVDISRQSRDLRGLQLDLQVQIDNFHGLTLHSQTSAESYYRRRDARYDRKTENENLWKPFWQARLIPSRD